MQKLFLIISSLVVLGFSQEAKETNVTQTVEENHSITHIVLCWIEPGVLKKEEVDSLIEQTKLLAKIPGVQQLKVGRPVPSERPIVDDTFTFGITMVFDSRVAMDAYLKHPDHTRFVQEHIAPHLAKLLVYDIEE